MRSMATIHELQVDFICLLHFLLSARRERLSIQTRLRQSQRFNFLDHRGLVELTTAASPRDCLLFPSGKGGGDYYDYAHQSIFCCYISCMQLYQQLKWGPNYR